MAIEVDDVAPYLLVLLWILFEEEGREEGFL